VAQWHAYLNHLQYVLWVIKSAWEVTALTTTIYVTCTNPKHTWRSAHPPRLTHRRHCPSTSVLGTQYCFPHTQYCNNDLTHILHYVETPIKYSQSWNHIISQTPPPPPPRPNRIQFIFVPCATTVRYLDLEPDSKLLFARHLHTVPSKATGVFSIPPSSPDIQRSDSPTR